ncbi:QsdR family transcriptional regulator [Gordonia sp. (in: high G+C Gram-positive bacteria)]|uniref:QsdR family transcriptional regulator n=1 Tax=unclassified Gordonia (in: high G+C Gram-positive bacteria) TaxID=2657482 RepID=UPI0026110E56|nr:QsdR family transcriptional regulator [Gordonia sp. (in: high G+C Gram-positive bacteria)]
MTTVQSPDVVVLARRAFVESGRIDMGALATAAGINRSTLYRRYKDRDRLLGEVIWTMAAAALDDAFARATGPGGARIADAMGRFATSSVRSAPFMDFLCREPDRALRVVTRRAGGVAGRIVDRIEGEVTAEVEAGRLAVVLPPHDTAYVLLRITESFVYADALAGESPDPAKVRQACAALLGVHEGLRRS